MHPSDIRVLVVEDETDNALVLDTALQYGGMQSWSAGSAELGLDLMDKVDPNLLIVDLALPGMDGWTFLEKVRANPATTHIPAVVVSAYLTPTVAQKALRAGFRACFPKPVNTGTLVQELMTLMDE